MKIRGAAAAENIPPRRQRPDLTEPCSCHSVCEAMRGSSFSCWQKLLAAWGKLQEDVHCCRTHCFYFHGKCIHFLHTTTTNTIISTSHGSRTWWNPARVFLPLFVKVQTSRLKFSFRWLFFLTLHKKLRLIPFQIASLGQKSVMENTEQS